MASFKNIKKNTSENASYTVYKKLTVADVVISKYLSKKYFSINGQDLKDNGVFSILYDRYITPPPPQLSLTPSTSATPSPSTTPSPSRTPSPSTTPASSQTPSPSKTPSPSTTPASSQTPSPSKTPSVSVSPSPSKTPSPSNTPSPSATPVFTGWEFTAGSYGVEVGYKQSVINGCPAIFGMFGSVPSSYTAGAFPGIDCYKIGPSLYTKGIGITGKGNAAPYLLGRFYDTGGGSLSMMLAKADGSSFNGTENINLSGTINGSNGTSSSWNCFFGAFPQYIDDNGNGTLDYYVTYGSLGMTGLTLTSGVTYTVTVTSGL